MAAKVGLGQLDADGENLQTHDDTSSLLGNGILATPCFRVDDIQGARAEEDADEGGERRFGEVEAVADGVGEEGVREKEDGKDEVGEMGGGGFELFA